MLIIYGASGYTGRLVLEQAQRQGVQPILGGRGAPPPIGQGTEYRRFALSHAAEIKAGLAGVTTLLNCAGPFSLTAPPLIDACLALGVNYLDLAGEVPEHAACAARDLAARTAGITLLPGVGFGVVPTDCAAALAVTELRPLATAERLIIAYETRGGASRGTLQTVLPDLHRPGVQRRGGALQPARGGQARRQMQDGTRRVHVLTNPWRADIISAYASTGVEQIETFSTFPPAAQLLMRIGGTAVGRVLARMALRGAAAGPAADQRAQGGTTIWAIAQGGTHAVQVLLHGPDAYDFTAICAVECARRAAQAPAGYQTPARAFGPDLVTGLGCTTVQITQIRSEPR